MSRMFGKCPIKGCKTYRVREGNSIIHPDGRELYLHHWMYTTKTSERRAFLKVLADQDLICPDHKEFLSWKALDVKPVNPEKNCDSRCMNAKRSGCDCPCRGQNHGAGNVM